MEKQVEKEHYNFLSYVDKGRWNSYYHQINEVLKSNSKNTLIIGKGDGIVSNILKDQVKEVKIFDIAEDLEPDYLGDVSNLTYYIDKEFDSILCCQVLEHLPFAKFEDCVKELSKATKKICIVSLPQQVKKMRIIIKLFKYKERKMIKYKFRNKEWKFNGEHYWEIGAKYYEIEKVRKIFERYFEILNEYTVEENDYHRFFILKNLNK